MELDRKSETNLEAEREERTTALSDFNLDLEEKSLQDFDIRKKKVLHELAEAIDRSPKVILIM
jgi:hypothetical protein